jgi:spore germination cell wall hydrolase CwlJ-like protein
MKTKMLLERKKPDKYGAEDYAAMALVSFIIFAIALLFGSCGTARAESEVVYQTIAMEASNQPLEGQIAVARVIINRARASNGSLESVCLASKQFSCWNSPKQAKTWLLRHYDDTTRDRAIKAYHDAIIANLSYPSINHYHTKQVKPYWAKGHNPSLVIGQHLFYAL